MPGLGGIAVRRNRISMTSTANESDLEQLGARRPEPCGPVPHSLLVSTQTIHFMKTNRAVSKKQSGAITRRTFIGTSAAAATFMILKPSVLGRAGNPSPNSKLNIAGVGIGGQGGWDVEAVKDENIVALCDVDWDYAAKAFELHSEDPLFKAQYGLLLHLHKHDMQGLQLLREGFSSLIAPHHAWWRNFYQQYV